MYIFYKVIENVLSRPKTLLFFYFKYKYSLVTF